nr:GEM-like protein 4 [Ipomoea batatas]
MKQNQTIKAINWAVLLNQSSRKWALPDSATQCHLSLSSKPSKTRNGKTSTSLKITDSVKGKLILGAKLLRAGGVQKVFKKNFGLREGEKLLKVSQCCLSTTAGPLAGLLFVSTEKVGFLSERSIRVPSSSGKSKRMHYKVLIPIAKIKTANESKNLKNPSEKVHHKLLKGKHVKEVIPSCLNLSRSLFLMSQKMIPLGGWELIGSLSSRKWALPDSATQCHLSLSSKPSKTRNGKTSTSLKITDSVKGKLILGAKLLRAGGIQKVFKNNFDVREGEKLLKASQCCLSTTAGPLAGLLFVSTEKVAFLSERSIRVRSTSGKSMRVHYKVLIPIANIKTANESKNLKNPSEKYVQVVTEDHFEFWFMWFQQHQRTLKYLQDAISQSAQIEEKAIKLAAACKLFHLLRISIADRAWTELEPKVEVDHLAKEN